jgi:hypothetical protein
MKKYALVVALFILQLTPLSFAKSYTLYYPESMRKDFDKHYYEMKNKKDDYIMIKDAFDKEWNRYHYKYFAEEKDLCGEVIGMKFYILNFSVDSIKSKAVDFKKDINKEASVEGYPTVAVFNKNSREYQTHFGIDYNENGRFGIVHLSEGCYKKVRKLTKKATKESKSLFEYLLKEHLKD